MAGRGVTITINVLEGQSDKVETLHLPVALHSPLEVLKQQLQDIVGIAVREQVLILLDLSDPDRNRDVLLIGRDHESLRQCGIRRNSVLTLHALGMSAELKQRMTRDALAKKVSNMAESEPIYTLSTPVTAAQADHSFNGIIFDVMCKSPYEVEITSISVAGMLGRVRIYARDRPWDSDRPDSRPSSNWFAHHDGISREGWTLVADLNCRPSWDRPYEIAFNAPVLVPPNGIRGLYCHSSLPDDLGIQYQSYGRTAIVAEDDCISIHPGLGHTGSIPFDENRGWFRSYRGLAGVVHYKIHRKGWSLQNHRETPIVMKNAVFQMLLCNHHLYQRALQSQMVPSPELYSNKEALPSPTSPRTVALAITRSHSESSDPMGSNIQTGYDIVVSSVHDRTMSKDGLDNVKEYSSYYDSLSENAFDKLSLGSLPVHILFNIFEFMDWDWYAELYGTYDFTLLSTLERYSVWKESHGFSDPIDFLRLLKEDEDEDDMDEDKEDNDSNDDDDNVRRPKRKRRPSIASRTLSMFNNSLSRLSSTLMTRSRQIRSQASPSNTSYVSNVISLMGFMIRHRDDEDDVEEEEFNDDEMDSSYHDDEEDGNDDESDEDEENEDIDDAEQLNDTDNTFEADDDMID